jgi:hypothetical protein
MTALLFLALVVVYALGVGGIVFVGWLIDGAPREPRGLEAQVARDRSVAREPSSDTALSPAQYFVRVIPTA